MGCCERSEGLEVEEWEVSSKSCSISSSDTTVSSIASSSSITAECAWIPCFGSLGMLRRRDLASGL